MCITNIYVDRYPDGKELSFQTTQYCQYGSAALGRPCQKHSTLSNPVRKIQFGEPTTEYMMTAPHAPHRVQFPSTPPRSRGGSRPGERDITPPGEGKILRRHSKRQSFNSATVLPPLKAHREHRKERIVIVDSPPTPRTPPMHFTQTFTAPSSPATPPYIVEGMQRRERGRPVIVDERPLRRERGRERDSSTSVMVGERIINNPPRQQRRARSQDRGVFQWDSPSSSHTSFDSRARREAEEAERRKERERDERLEADRRREQRIREQDEEIRRRPAVPLPPNPLRRRESISVRSPTPVVDQSRLNISVRKTTSSSPAPSHSSNEGRPRLVVPMTPGELALAEEAEIRRRMAERDREAKRELEREVNRAREKKAEEEAMVQRLRERQMPKRRFSVGPGGRRHRVLYDDGVYRWE